MFALARLPLPLLLAILTLGELGLNRIGVRLLLNSRFKQTELFGAVDLAGLFLFHLTGVLALALVTWAAVVVLRDRNLLRLPERVVLAGLFALFLPQAAFGMVTGLPIAMVPQLNIAFCGLVVVWVVGVMRRPALASSQARYGHPGPADPAPRLLAHDPADARPGARERAG